MGVKIEKVKVKKPMDEIPHHHRHHQLVQEIL
jgi:hypothetical protein